ncbi:MAG: hypothetical protein GX541_02350 [Clostridiales bacterium]|nr:hypothetical protein [Clostridiales bacterium]
MNNVAINIMDNAMESCGAVKAGLSSNARMRSAGGKSFFDALLSMVSDMDCNNIREHVTAGLGQKGQAGFRMLFINSELKDNDEKRKLLFEEDVLDGVASEAFGYELNPAIVQTADTACADECVPPRTPTQALPREINTGPPAYTPQSPEPIEKDGSAVYPESEIPPAADGDPGAFRNTESHAPRILKEPCPAAADKTGLHSVNDAIRRAIPPTDDEAVFTGPEPENTESVFISEPAPGASVDTHRKTLDASDIPDTGQNSGTRDSALTHEAYEDMRSPEVFSENKKPGIDGTEDPAPEHSAAPTLPPRRDEKQIPLFNAAESKAAGVSSEKQSFFDTGRVGSPVVDKIVKEFELVSKKDSDCVRIALDPPGIGYLTLKVSSDKNGIHARIITESMRVLEELNQNSSNLINSLKEVGVKLTGIDVQYVHEADIRSGQGGASGSGYGQQTGYGQEKWQTHYGSLPETEKQFEAFTGSVGLSPGFEYFA